MLWWRLRQLRSGDEQARKAAAKKLGQSSSPKAVEALVTALEDESLSVSYEAIKSLVRIGDKRAIEPLVKELHKAPSNATVEALDSLGWEPENDRERALRAVALKQWDDVAKLGDEAIELLIDTLKSTDYKGHIGISSALAKVGDLSDEQLEKILVLLESSNSNTVSGAARVLNELGDSRTLLPLISFLKNKEKIYDQRDAQVFATLALGKLKDTRAVDVLLLLLKDPYVDRVAVDALGNIGDPRAFEPLAALTYDLVVPAIKALAKIPDPRVPALLLGKFNTTDKAVRKAAVTALGEIVYPSESAIEPLLEAVTIVPNHAYSYADVLARIGENAVIPLVAALERSGGYDKDQPRAECAMLALARIGGSKAKEALLKRLELPYGVVEAASALVQMKSPEVLDVVIDRLWATLEEAKDTHYLEKAVRVLGNVPNERATQLLITTLSHWDDVARMIAGLELKERGWKPANDTERALWAVAGHEWYEATCLRAAAVKPLANVVLAKGNTDAYAREMALECLGKIGVPGIGALLFAAKKSSKRSITVRGSGSEIDNPTLEPALKALADKTNENRIVLARALARLHDPRAVEPLVELTADQRYAKEAIESLQEVLEAAESNVPETALRAVLQIKEPILQIWHGGKTFPVSCSVVKQLAQRQLTDQGLSA